MSFSYKLTHYLRKHAFTLARTHAHAHTYIYDLIGIRDNHVYTKIGRTTRYVYGTFIVY